MGYILSKVIYVVFALVELILGLRFILRLFGANPANGFVEWVYRTSGSVLDPFRGIFLAQTIDGGFVIEFSTLFAVIIYAIIALLLTYIVTLITRPIDRAVEHAARKR